MKNLTLRALPSIALAILCVTSTSNAIELGPIDGGVQQAFGYTLGAPIDASAKELNSTADVDRYEVLAQSYPEGVRTVVLQLSSLTHRVVLIKAEGQTASPAACSKLVKNLQKQMKKSLGLKFKKSKVVQGAQVATSGTTERELGCTDNAFHFVLRDPELDTLASNEIQTLRSNAACAKPLPPRPPALPPTGVSTAIVSSQFTPVRKVELRDFSAPLASIAARVRAHYEHYIQREPCEAGGLMQYAAVIDVDGRVVEVKRVDFKLTSAVMLELAEREIKLQRFVASSEAGYRMLAFALNMKPAPSGAPNSIQTVVP
jgi:hypothetical protein